MSPISQCWCTRYAGRITISNIESAKMSTKRKKKAFAFSVPYNCFRYCSLLVRSILDFIDVVWEIHLGSQRVKIKQRTLK